MLHVVSIGVNWQFWC